jgi:hypothetical protein
MVFCCSCAREEGVGVLVLGHVELMGWGERTDPHLPVRGDPEGNGAPGAITKGILAAVTSTI